MKMGIINNCLSFVTNTRMKICITFLSIMCTFVMMNIYCHRHVCVQLHYQQDKLSVDMKNEQRIVKNIGINATHINGILMEPIHINYIRNIYFTVKTTHKYYTSRLFPLMLTWLQAVDKNKVRWHQYIIYKYVCVFACVCVHVCVRVCMCVCDLMLENPQSCHSWYFEKYQF